MKRHLENWYAGIKERLCYSRRGQYKEAKLQNGEGYRIFATRLENLFRMAYPHRKVDGKDLCRQLINALPRSSGETLERDLALLRTATGRQNTWKDVLKLLEVQDESVRRSGHGRERRNFKGPQELAGATGSPYLNMNVKKPQNLERFNTGKSNTENRAKSASPKFLRSPGQIKCNWCKRPGHKYDYCRRRLNQCLRCGSDEHHVARCPEPCQRMIKAEMSPARQKKRASLSSSCSETSPRQERSRTPEVKSRVIRRSSNDHLNVNPLV